MALRKNVRNKTELIHDIARETGVSLATAYRSVTAPDTVAEDTRARVLEMMRSRNISISRRPRVAKPSRSATQIRRVAFLVPHMMIRSVEAMSEEMTHGIQTVFANRGIELLLHHYAWDADPSVAISKLPALDDLDGVLLRPPANRALLEALCRGRKVVLLGNSFPDIDVPSVVADDDCGIGSVMEYLFELGHRRIAFVSLVPRMSIYRRRMNAYVGSLIRWGIPADLDLIKLHDGWMTGTDEAEVINKRFIKELFSLREPPTGIVCTSDSFGAGLMVAAREQGIRVPEQLSITGYGDQYFAALSDPPLTTVHVDQSAIGEAAAFQLLQLIEGGPRLVQSLVRPKLIERRSCAAAKESCRKQQL